MDRIASYFDDCVGQFGNNVNSVGWISPETQLVRFDALATMADFSGCSVLDVGSGLGDLYKYLNDNYSDMEYTGIDLSRSMLAQAKKNFPDARFDYVDIENYKPEKSFDYVLASGPFNIRVDDNYSYIAKALTKMWMLASRGLAFNLLSSYAPIEFKDDFFFYYQPEKIFTICKLLSQNVIVRHDYLPNDMTFILYK